MDVPIQLRPPHPQHGGLPVPFIVSVIDGIPVFSINDEVKRCRAIRERLCGQCGKPLYRNVAFVGGPSTIETHLSEEPGMHEACARYALSTCPYMANSGYKVRGRKINSPTAIMVPGSRIPPEPPSQMALILTQEYRAQTVRFQTLAHFGRIRRVVWYSRGREVET